MTPLRTAEADVGILFTPFALGEIMLANRIIMAPMMRSRAGAGDVPSAAMADITRSARVPALLLPKARSRAPRGPEGYCDYPTLKG